MWYFRISGAPLFQNTIQLSQLPKGSTERCSLKKVVILENITKGWSCNLLQSPCQISVKEFMFQKFADLQPTTLPKMSSFKVFFSGIFPIFYFSLGTPTLRNTFEWLFVNFCFSCLFSTNKKTALIKKNN